MGVKQQPAHIDLEVFLLSSYLKKNSGLPVKLGEVTRNSKGEKSWESIMSSFLIMYAGNYRNLRSTIPPRQQYETGFLYTP